jgi:hypothetical protein
MCRLFRGAVLGLEVQCLKALGLRLRDHALAFTPLVDHIFLVMIAFPPADHILPFVVIALLLGLG